MKRVLFFAALCLTLCSCREALFEGAACPGNERPVYPLHLEAGRNRVLLTDYYPAWEGADSITSRDLSPVPVAADWSEFEVSAPEGPFVATLEVWRGGRSLSIVALGGAHRPDVYMFSSGSMLKVASVAASRQPTRIVALWQNCRLPDREIVRIDDSFGIIVPKDARRMERSYLRVYASADSALFNDVLIPLEHGRIVKSASRLGRHDPEAQVLYSLMIDRFSNGDTANDRRLDRPDVLPRVDYMGGDLKGITDKIEAGFFDDLGVTTVWISPITQNPYDAWGLNEEPFTRFSGYHGYWPIYTTRIDERFGTDAQLREMLSSAHERGMNVILDYVANHLHIDSPVLKEHPDWTTSMYLPDGRRNLGLWDEERLTTWFDVHIPTLDLERDEICEPMTDSALYWIANYDFDGFRHDACKHIPENYWRMLTRKMKTRFGDRQFWQIGETYGSPQLIASYVKSGMIDAQFDFNLYHTAVDVLLDDAPMERVAHEVARSAAAYGAHHTMGNITGNHDKPRFISLAGGALSPHEDSKLAGWTREIGVGDTVGYRKLALLGALIMTVPGVPCIYQGDEYGVPGANDPDNRRMMQFSGYTDREEAQKDLTRKLIALRRSHMPLLYGDMVPLYLEGNVWAFARQYLGEYVIVVLNNGPCGQEIPLRLPAGFDANQKLKTNFGGTLRPAGAEAQYSLRIAPYDFEILTRE